MRKLVEIDIWSDIACPWCYIGKPRLERALVNYGTKVRIKYHSFQMEVETTTDYLGPQAEFLTEYKYFPFQTLRPCSPM
ncbi:DsbA family protein [Pseudomonas taiwanensis]|uniref:DsbA family protein n=1 Tax=Pseudomonas taiwanensis TaxID=470150 RepID=A0ABR6V3D0_9PSED|nr:DsbA family protein [Pseudomonas taiwanensis]